MDPEVYFDMFFMLIGLAFFIFMMRLVQDDTNRQHERDLQRDREFGLREPRSFFTRHKARHSK